MLETGRIGLSRATTLQRIATVLGVTVVDLFAETANDSTSIPRRPATPRASVREAVRDLTPRAPASRTPGPSTKTRRGRGKE
jgi:hypothetical protein